ncbi:MAG: hypothetical protein GC181_04835 [Bacteroidetes bacterium]|nr:hypothetical protein [Bacteroidota bacterium]
MKRYLKTEIRAWVITLITLGFTAANAQTTRQILPATINRDLSLAADTIIVKGKVVVEENATLTLGAGKTILFYPKAAIQIKGGLDLQGAPNKFIEFKNYKADQPGVGFVISEANQQNIKVNYTRFEGVLKPFLFEKNWSRRNVEIKNSQFQHHIENGVYIEFRELDKVLTNDPVTLLIQGNTFSNNSGSVMFAEATADLLKLVLKDNVFSRNEFIGRSLNGIFTTPVFLNENAVLTRGMEPIIKGNSFCFNYGSLVLEDTVEFFPVNITAVGSADFLDVNGNFFGENATKDLDEMMKQMISSQRAPLLLYNDLPLKPYSTTNGHIYKIAVDGVRIDDLHKDVTVNEYTSQIEMIANRPVTVSDKFQVTYIYLMDDTLRYESLNHKLEFSNMNQKVQVSIHDRIIKMRPNGYIMVQGLVDENGFMVPDVHVGLKNFLIKNNVFLSGYESFLKIPRVEQTTPRLYDEGEFPLPTVDELRDTTLKNVVPELDPDDTMWRSKYWDVAVFGGTTLYFGDLAYTNVAISLNNLRPNLGFRFGYNFTERIRIEIAQNNLVIAGADDRSSILGAKRGTNFARGLSVRTTIYDLGIIGEYRLSRYRKMRSIVPSAFIGITGYYFNPQSQINNEGRWYDLRPLRTEGQATPYSKYGVGIPMGIKLTKHLNKYTTIGVSYTYNKVFTDYLDDVSTGKFQTDEYMEKANPDLGTIAVQLSNPNGIKPGTRRSSSAKNDGYSYFGVTLTRKFRF